MNFDMYGLPVQADGDANDQLNRVGMIETAQSLTDTPVIPSVTYYKLEQGLGVFIRHKGGNPNNVSADQLIPVITALVAEYNPGSTLPADMFIAMVKRGGFAQNTHDFDPSKPGWKLPDFMALRAMPLFCRLLRYTKHMRLIFDLYLPILVLGDYFYQKFDKDPCDINCTLATLAVCYKKEPSIWSKLAVWMWPKMRRNIMEAMQRYHRAEAGGNPEIALLWKPIIEDICR